MRLLSVSRLVFPLAVLSLVLAGLFPSPLMIGVAASVTSGLVLWQAYAILRDDSGPTPTAKRSPYDGYLRK